MARTYINRAKAEGLDKSQNMAEESQGATAAPGLAVLDSRVQAFDNHDLGQKQIDKYLNNAEKYLFEILHNFSNIEQGIVYPKAGEALVLMGDIAKLRADDGIKKIENLKLAYECYLHAFKLKKRSILSIAEGGLLFE